MIADHPDVVEGRAANIRLGACRSREVGTRRVRLLVLVLVEASSRPSLLPLAVGGFEFEFVVLSRAP
jgi:hypothetical protein